MHQPVPRVVYVSGASSGIGEALTESVPYSDSRVIGISRRPCRSAEHLEADLSQPTAWRVVAERFDRDLADPGVAEGIFLHMAASGPPYGRALPATLDAYASSVVLNSASGQVLGKAFLSTCAKRSIRATVVLCSSPATMECLPGMTHYGAGKTAVEYWVRSLAAEEAGRADLRVFSVMPFATDTPMARAAIEESGELVPIPLLEAARRGEMASAADTAREIWALVTGDTASGAVVPVGAVPGLRPSD
jgi:benzil reductase ((S)-benzoin forming)